MASKVFEVAFKLGAELTSSFKSAFKDAGSTLKTLSGAVAAIGGVTAISNVASQVDAVNGSFNKLQIQTGITGKEFEELQEISKNLFKEIIFIFPMFFDYWRKILLILKEDYSNLKSNQKNKKKKYKDAKKDLK